MRGTETFQDSLVDLTHYELLEVDPGAADAQIRQALKRAREIYAPDSMVIYTLFTDDELEVISHHIDLAYETLIDPRKRREYDLSLLGDPSSEKEEGTPRHQLELSDSPGGSSGAATRQGKGKGKGKGRRPHERVSPEALTRSPEPDPKSVETGSDLPSDLEITEKTYFTGEMLRRIREHREVDLRDVSDITKISLMNLRYLEEMAFAEFPAAVYVKGFLRVYARHLGLPEAQVADTYMDAYQAYLLDKALEE